MFSVGFFDVIENATLTTQRPGVFTSDPVSGVPSASTSPEVYRAWLKATAKPSLFSTRIENELGGNLNLLSVKGRLVSPIDWQFQVVPNQQFDVEIVNGNQAIQGLFYLAPTIQDQDFLTVPDIGKAISGVVVVRTTFGQST